MASNPTRVKTRSPVNQGKTQPSTPVRLKAIVRRLPPNLPQTVFWQTVHPWVSDELVSWKVFYQGKLRKKLNKENVPSRAYVFFKNEEGLASFSRGFDGHVFRDKQGNESQAVVEFAPNQKVPPEKKKADSRHATIQQDEDYLSFVAALQNTPPKTTEVDMEALLASTQTPEEPKTTPLLTSLLEQKASAHEKKLAAAEAAKAHARKAAAAPVSGPKAEVEDAVHHPTGKRGRRGKGTSHHPAASVQLTTPNSASNQPAKATKTNGGGRNRPTSTSGNSVGGPSSSSAPSATTSSTNKEPIGKTVDETSQKKNRPVLGLQSRHLKVALNGAGVTMSPTSQLASTSTSGASPASVPIPEHTTSRPTRGVPTGGGERKDDRGGKDGPTKVSGGRGGGKERGRSRHHAGPGPATAGSGTGRGMDVAPRILSRADSLNLVEPSSRDRIAANGAQDSGPVRGRGRRGIAQF